MTGKREFRREKLKHTDMKEEKSVERRKPKVKEGAGDEV